MLSYRSLLLPSLFLMAVPLCNPAAAQMATAIAVPTTQGSVDPVLMGKIQDSSRQLSMLMRDKSAIVDPDKRKQTLETAKPLVVQLEAEWKAMVAKHPSNTKIAGSNSKRLNQMLALLGDADANEKLNKDAESNDPAISIIAHAQLLENRWALANKDVPTQTTIVDDLEKLDRAHPDSVALTQFTYSLTMGSVSRQLSDRLIGLCTAVMHNTAADRIAANLKKMNDSDTAQAKTHRMVGKPFVLTGKTSDGKDFSTADWKGKVVLVDFWATWCGPCNDELPELQNLFTDMHDKGLEFVSVSNDFDLKALQKFTAEHKMPWPQLFDAASAADQKFSSVSLSYGINKIPHVFVIDRNGILLDDDARYTYKDLVEKALAGKTTEQAALQ